MSASLHRAFRRLTADKKKLSIMLALVAVGLLMWARMWLQQRPGTAEAELLTAPASSLLTNPAPEASANRPTVYVDLPEHAPRDLFALDAKVYPAAPSLLPINAGPEKSGPHPADDSARAAAARTEAAVRADAMKLKLQTTMQGDSPRATINGQLIAPGEPIEGFTLLRILPREVVVEKNGIQVRLGM